ncbi:MAG: signal peptidase I [Actinomycetales bacterium]
MSEEPTDVSDKTTGDVDATAETSTSSGSTRAPARSSGSGGRHGKPRGRRSAVLEVVLVVVLSLALSSLIKTFLVQAFFVPSESMENTLKVHDRILVSKLTPRFHDIQRGDVVVFQDPGGWLDPSELPHRTGVAKVAHDILVGVGVLPDDTVGDLVKRVIGVGGDHIVCCTRQGQLTVNGVTLKEPYLYPGNQASDTPFDVTVPQGYIWVMGDHRGVSRDSRAHIDDPRHGMVPVGNVLGRVFVIIWPVDRWSGIGRPDTFASIPPPSTSAGSSAPPASTSPASAPPASAPPASTPPQPSASPTTPAPTSGG